jgi:hypothetical protein
MKQVHPPEEEKASCEICGKEVRCKSSLVQHLKTHEPKVDKEKVLCELCGKGFKGKEGLKTHTDSVHNRIRHNCSHCGDGFSRPETLKKHIQAKHEENAGPGFPCPHCEKTFKFKDYLKQHLRSKVHGGQGLSRSKKRTRTNEEKSESHARYSLEIETSQGHLMGSDDDVEYVEERQPSRDFGTRTDTAGFVIFNVTSIQ